MHAKTKHALRAATKGDSEGAFETRRRTARMAGAFESLLPSGNRYCLDSVPYTKCARRFCCQQASVWSVQNGRSFP